MADLDQINKLLREQVELRSKIARLNGEIISAGDQEVAVLQKQQSLAKEIQAAALQEYERKQNSNDLTTEGLNKLNKFMEYQKKSLDMELRRGDISIENYQKQLELYKEIRDAQEAGDQARLDALVKQAQQVDDLNDKLKEGAKQGSRLASAFGSLVGFGPQAQQLGQSVMGMATNFGKSRTAIKSFGSQLGQVFGPAGVLGFLIQNTIAATLQSASLQAQFVSATGATEDFQQRMSELGAATNEAFTRFSLMGQLAPLRNFMVSFAEATEATQDKFVVLSNSLERLGMGAMQNAQFFNQLQTEFGFFGESAGQAAVDLFGLAEDLKQPPNEVIAALQDASPVLGQFGRKGVTQFANIAKSAKSMGFAVKEGTQFLMQMADGFDTFDSAATKVAEFNAFLGGPHLNTYDMVMASGKGVDEVLAQLKDGFDSAGFGADDMSENLFKARGVANALGVDVNKLEKFLRGTITQEELMRTETQDLIEVVKGTVGPMEAISNSLTEATARFKTIEKSITGFIDLVTEIIQRLTSAESAVGLFMYTLGGMLASVGKAKIAFAAFGGVVAGIGFALLALPAMHSALLEFMGGSTEASYGLAIALGAVTAAIIAMKAVATFGASLAYDAKTIIGASAIAGGIGGALLLGGDSEDKVSTTGATPDLGTASGMLERANMQFQVSQGMEDGFVTKQPSGNFEITPISSMDSLVAYKQGGPIENMGLDALSADKLIAEFTKLAAKMEQVASRPVQVKSTVTMPNNRVLAEATNEYNNEKYNRKYY